MASDNIDAGMKQLQTLPGIGRWTANYFALRGWQAPDIFLPDDYLIKQRFPGMTPTRIARYASRWHPLALLRFTPYMVYGRLVAGAGIDPSGA